MRSRGFALAALLLATTLGCSSDPLETCSDTGSQTQPFSKRCLRQSFDPITETSNPNYGRVACQMLAAWPIGSPECSCAVPGYASVNAAEREFAASKLAGDGECASACCPELCFCEFLQHSGDELAACQSRPSTGEYDGGPTGWCYVEPGLGFGTIDDVLDCPADQPRKIRYYPDDPRFNLFAVIRCVGEP